MAKGTRADQGHDKFPQNLPRNVDHASIPSSLNTDGISSTAKTNKLARPTNLATPTLTISRNKHWRYISAFHGPWLQLPHEILETLALTNFFCDRPRQTDPGVLYDLLKIRKLVDEASSLAVRAQNGTASSALHKNDNGFPGGALGFSSRSGGQAKLSAERKFRMRELATQKLSQAYRLDEVAASVATMQSASSLDSVSDFVLQRDQSNVDARYVHFFHEKIPSRMVAEHTPLNPLDEVITHQSNHSAPWRTRALTKVFHDDHHGAVVDLTEALMLCRIEQSKHTAGKDQMVTLQEAKEQAERRKVWSRDWMHDNRVADEDQPSSMEKQLLFQRGSQYLALASKNARKALDLFREANYLRQKDVASLGDPPDGVHSGSESQPFQQTYRQAVEARDLVRKYAKRSLKDFTSFLTTLDYAHAPISNSTDDLFQRDDLHGEAGDRYHDSSVKSSSLSLVKGGRRVPVDSRDDAAGLAQPAIYKISDLLSSTPPSTIPLFSPGHAASATTDGVVWEHSEMVTYHPLLLETLHSFLLAHCLLQTSPTTLQRITINVARLARLIDGYPFFLSTRSPARSDWTEVLRKTGNWVNIAAAWEDLCRPPPSRRERSQQKSPSQSHPNSVNDALAVHDNSNLATPARSNPDSGSRKWDAAYKEVLMGALSDERVFDDATFAQAVSARERRAQRDKENGGPYPLSPAAVSADSPLALCSDDPSLRPSSSGSSATAATSALSTPTTEAKETNSLKRAEAELGQGVIRRASLIKDDDYLIGTERAISISQWILDAPTSIDAKLAGIASAKRKGKGKGRARKSKAEVTTVVQGVEEVDLD